MLVVEGECPTTCKREREMSGGNMSRGNVRIPDGQSQQLARPAEVEMSSDYLQAVCLICLAALTLFSETDT